MPFRVGPHSRSGDYFQYPIAFSFPSHELISTWPTADSLATQQSSPSPRRICWCLSPHCAQSCSWRLRIDAKMMNKRQDYTESFLQMATQTANPLLWSKTRGQGAERVQQIRSKQAFKSYRKARRRGGWGRSWSGFWFWTLIFEQPKEARMSDGKNGWMIECCFTAGTSPSLRFHRGWLSWP